MNLDLIVTGIFLFGIFLFCFGLMVIGFSELFVSSFILDMIGAICVCVGCLALTISGMGYLFWVVIPMILGSN